MLLSLNFEKAFDTLELEFMLKCLKKFNFGDGFLNWIKILNTDTNVVIKSNGFLSREIKLSTGLQQGCPISALIGILCVEIMAIKYEITKILKILFLMMRNTKSVNMLMIQH